MRPRLISTALLPWLLAAACWPGAWLAHGAGASAAPTNPAAATQWLITVRSGQEMARAREKDSPSPSARTYRTQDRNGGRQVRVLDGHSAYISHSQSTPYPVVVGMARPYGEHPFYGVDYRAIQQGFSVRPRWEAGQLLLDISAVNQRGAEQGGGSIDSSTLQTSVRVEPGQWTRLGGGRAAPAADAGAGGKRLATAVPVDRDEIWVRVEPLD